MTGSRTLFPLAAILRVTSRIACLIVIASFAIFAVGQTGEASVHQQEELNGTAVAATAPNSTGALPPREGAVHRTIDEAASTLTSPFSAITAGSSSQWLVRGVDLLMALLVYGFGLGYLARVIRVKV
jgi:hypothetical protein